MTDITSRFLEAAIIDQKVAGEFRGVDYAYVAVIHEGKYMLGIAVANEDGYSPVISKEFNTDVEAKEWAKGLNDHIGRFADDVMQIIISTMGGVTYNRRWPGARNV